MTQPDPIPLPFEHTLLVGALRREGETAFDVRPSASERIALAAFLAVDSVPMLHFTGKLAAWQERGWALEGRLAAEVVQSCVVTLEPVHTAIDTPVERRYLPRTDAAADETEAADEDGPELFTDRIELAEAIVEALTLAIEPYPRAAGAELGRLLAAPPGTEPLSDEKLRPFSGLEALKRKLEDGA